MHATVLSLGRTGRRAVLFLCLVAGIVLSFASLAMADSSDDAFHSVARTDSCVSCHAGGALTTVHAVSGCDPCHNSPDPDVQAAFNSGNMSCSACHPTQGVDYHTAFTPAHTFSAMGVGCQAVGCHSSSLTTAHASAVGPTGSYPQYPDTCALCHMNQDPVRVPAGATADCSSCHASADHTVVHVVERADECASCHTGGDLIAVHASSTCDACHASADTAVTAAIAAGDKACPTCHEGGSHDALHVSVTTSSCFGIGCHDASKSLVAVHAPYVGEGSPHPEFASACELCHDNPAVDPSTTGTSCTPACHSGTTHSQYASSHTPTTASDTCAVCHGADLTGIHGASDDLTRCAVCHAESGNWGKTADCANCHSGESHDDLHVVTVSPACAGCHSGSSLTPIHAAIGCDGCHESADERVVSAIAGHQTGCAACHDGHPDLAGAHTVAAVSGVVVVTDHGTPVLDCGMCHVSADIRAVHDDCAVCHSAGGPLTSFATWGRTCQQGACHPIAHGSAVGGHAAVECAECHLGGNYDLGSALAYCGECHALTDLAAPVTTSDARPSYSGPAPIKLTARDTPNPGGSGVARTYCIVDGAAPVEGTFVVVAGNGPHTIEFWSVDGAGNVEDAHTVSAFVIVADTAAPSTTMQGVSAGGSYATARTIALAATDDGSVADTFHRLSPGGPVTRGTSFTAPLPATPGQTVSYTLTYWSVDRSGNEEAHHAVAFSVTNPVDGSIAVNVFNDYIEEDAAGQEVWITNGSGVEVARGVTDAMGNWTATVPLGSGYVAHTSTTYGTPFSSQGVPALSTDKPTATVWLMTVHP